MKPFESDLEAHLYHKRPGISSTEVRTIAKGGSPKHVKFSRENPSEPDARMIMGTAAHAVLSGTWEKEILVVDCDSRGYRKPSKEQKQLLDEKPHLVTITKENKERAEAMVASVMKHPEASDIIESAIHEGNFFWEVGGVPFKARADLVNDAMEICADFKTTGDASRGGFLRAVRYGYYDIQAIHYLEGIHEATNRDGYEWRWIVVEQDPPFESAVFALHPECLEPCRRIWREAVEILIDAENTGEWPGYDPILEEFSLDDLRLRYR